MNVPFFAKKEASLDPYAHLEKPSNSQLNSKEHNNLSHSSSSSSAPVSSSDSKKRRLEIDVNDIEPVLIKLRDNLVGTNPLKIEKAAGLMVQYLDGKLNNTNVDLFMKHISSLDSKENEIYALPYARVFSSIRDKMSVFGTSHEYQITSNYIFYCLGNRLTTDDSYDFIAACKELSSYISEMEQLKDKEDHRGGYLEGKAEEQEGGKHRKEVQDNHRGEGQNTGCQYRVDAILRCMEIAYKKYHFLWARNPIEKVFLKATGLRFILHEDSLKRLDELVNKQEVERRKRVYSAGPQTVRTLNSVHNPLSKKQANTLLR